MAVIGIDKTKEKNPRKVCSSAAVALNETKRVQSSAKVRG